MISRRHFMMTTAVAAMAAPALTASPAFAMKKMVYTSWGVAIRGTDPVAYFTENRPVEGSKKYTTYYDGAEFRFASAENLVLFKENPEKYAPQYGGYCAWAVSHGYTASTVPEAFTIHDGKLYLNYSLTVRFQWEADKETRIKLGDQNWPAVLDR